MSKVRSGHSIFEISSDKDFFIVLISLEKDILCVFVCLDMHVFVLFKISIILFLLFN